MKLSDELLTQFAKITNDTSKSENSSTVYGTVVEDGGTMYVRIDGSELLTPVSTTTEMKNGERVTVTIKDHTAIATGNLSSPAARTGTVNDIAQIVNSTFEMSDSGMYILGSNVKVDGSNVDITSNSDITLMNSKINIANSAFNIVDGRITGLSEVVTDSIVADTAVIGSIASEVIETNEINSKFITTEQLKSKNIEAGFIDADEISASFITSGFANITTAEVKKLFSSIGIIDSLTVGDDMHVTGKLVALELDADLIQSGTLKAEHIVIEGDDGLLYSLNANALGEAGMADVIDKAALKNQLHGAVITDDTITAKKIHVDDLQAFGATIGGFDIDEDSIHTHTKTSVDNNMQGLYFGSDGQIAIGGSEAGIKLYKEYVTDENGNYLYFDVDDNIVDEETGVRHFTWRLNITANDVTFAGSNKTFYEELEDMKDLVSTNLILESSRGTCFKNNTANTILSAKVFRNGLEAPITSTSDLRRYYGETAHIVWYELGIDDEDKYLILSDDIRFLNNDNFMMQLRPDDVKNQVTFTCELVT